VVEILDSAADDDFVHAEQLAVTQLDLEVAEPLVVEECSVIHGCDGRWSRMVCSFWCGGKKEERPEGQEV
jgi:hypothetical protein